LNWDGVAPKLFLNIFPPNRDNLFVLGMVEAAGLGWQGKLEQSELIAKFILALDKKTKQLFDFQECKNKNSTDVSGGVHYKNLERMAYYVHKDTYRQQISKWVKKLGKDI
jgi:hypothetical protein